jgi:Kef-type K+ transport system membrane component KefB/mannitol/fructose-specific phosphotransferase system IIA component (Ntr-type)
VQLPVTDPVVVVAIIAAVIVASPLLLERHRIPGVIGVLIAGAILGPNALGVLERDQAIVLLGTMGLIYIMFSAGLEIDLAVLKRSRVESIGFGLMTFAIPQGIGTLVAYFLLGFDLPAAVLLASMFASHTLLAYPVASRLGLAKNRAVTAALGGTIVTDTLALLVLAVVASSSKGELDSAFWMNLGVSMTLYVGGILILVPQLARWFFRHLKPDGPVEFMFVLATVFACAGLSHSAGVEPIVGAFLAGLALNRMIPHGSTLMNRISFTGDALFVPFFLLSVGMLLDVRIFFAGIWSWVISLSMVAMVIVCKFLAAELARLVFRYERAEARLVFGLSLAQAAATLAAVMVGYRIGLFDDAVLNGAILMMLVTCIWAPIIVHKHGRTLALALEQAPAAEGHPQRILVSLSKAETAPPLIDLALMLRDGGQHQPVYPFTVARGAGSTRDAVAYAEKMLSHAVVRCTSADVPSHPVTRIDINVASALGRAQRELRISDIVIGWSDKPSAQERLFGTFLEHLLESRDFTLWMTRIRNPLNTTRRVVFVVPPHAASEPQFAAATSSIKLLASRLSAQLVVYTPAEEREQVRRRIDELRPQLELKLNPIESWSTLVTQLSGQIADLDLVVVYSARPGALSFTRASTRLPQRIAARFPDASMLVVYPGEPTEDAAPRLDGEDADLPAFVRKDRIAFGIERVGLVGALSTVLEEAHGKLDAELLVPELLGQVTDLTDGVVMLQARSSDDAAHVLIGTSHEGISRGAGRVHVVFVVLHPAGENPQAHLDRLGDIARLAATPGLIDRVRSARGLDEVLAAFRKSGSQRIAAPHLADAPPADPVSPPADAEGATNDVAP